MYKQFFVKTGGKEQNNEKNRRRIWTCCVRERGLEEKWLIWITHYFKPDLRLMYTHIYFYIPLMIFIHYFQIGHELWLTKFLFNQTVVTHLFCWIFGLFFYTFSAFQIDNFKGPCDFSFRYFILFYFLNFDENYLIICWYYCLLV